MCLKDGEKGVSAKRYEAFRESFECSHNRGISRMKGVSLSHGAERRLLEAIQKPANVFWQTLTHLKRKINLCGLIRRDDLPVDVR